MQRKLDHDIQILALKLNIFYSWGMCCGELTSGSEFNAGASKDPRVVVESCPDIFSVLNSATSCDGGGLLEITSEINLRSCSSSGG